MPLAHGEETVLARASGGDHRPLTNWRQLHASRGVRDEAFAVADREYAPVFRYTVVASPTTPSTSLIAVPVAPSDDIGKEHLGAHGGHTHPTCPHLDLEGFARVPLGAGHRHSLTEVETFRDCGTRPRRAALATITREVLGP